MRNQSLTGTVKFFNEDKGYGFIIRDDSNKEVFFHRTGVKSSDANNINKNCKVEFNIEQSKKGEIAVNVTKI